MLIPLVSLQVKVGLVVDNFLLNVLSVAPGTDDRLGTHVHLQKEQQRLAEFRMGERKNPIRRELDPIGQKILVSDSLVNQRAVIW